MKICDFFISFLIIDGTIYLVFYLFNIKIFNINTTSMYSSINIQIEMFIHIP